jgi:hypothetical protein
VSSVTTLSGAEINTVDDRRLNNKRTLRNNTDRGKPKYLEIKLPYFTASNQSPTKPGVVSNAGLRAQISETNCLNYGAALSLKLKKNILQENSTVVLVPVTKHSVGRKRGLNEGGFFSFRKSYMSNNDCMGTDHVFKRK